MGLGGELALAALMLATGSLNTVSKKIMYQTNGTTIEGTIEKYQKPWLCTFIMFCGESMCMLFFYIFKLHYHLHKPSAEDSNISMASEADASPKEKKIVFVSREETQGNPTGGLNWRFPFIVILLSTCDLLSTTLTGIGLIYVNASVVQILRGFVIVFTMLNAWLFLDRRPKTVQVIGVCFALIGLALVGTSALMSDKSSDGGNFSDTLLGIGLTLLSQIFSSIQFVFEEKLLKQNTNKVSSIPPLFLVGSEGIAGALLSICVAIPIVNAIPGKDFGSYENMDNSFYMMLHNPLITGLQFLYFISIAFFNWSSFVYSRTLSATARTLVDACRTILVWITMVCCFYGTTHKYGEGLTLWSILQVVGFVGMLLGTTTHNNIGGFGDKVIATFSKREAVNSAPLLAKSSAI